MSEPKYIVVRTTKFKRGYKLAKKQGKDLALLAWGVGQLERDIPYDNTI